MKSTLVHCRGCSDLPLLSAELALSVSGRFGASLPALSEQGCQDFQLPLERLYIAQVSLGADEGLLSGHAQRSNLVMEQHSELASLVTQKERELAALRAQSIDELQEQVRMHQKASKTQYESVAR